MNIKNNDITNQIIEIWLDENINTHDFISKEYWKENETLMRNHYLPNSETFVYSENDMIKGFISIINNYFIGALFVKKDYQRKGIGTYLLNRSKDNYEKLQLAVYLENKLAINFYEKSGFKIIEKNKNEDTGFDEYLMEWIK